MRKFTLLAIVAVLLTVAFFAGFSKGHKSNDKQELAEQQIRELADILDAHQIQFDLKFDPGY